MRFNSPVAFHQQKAPPPFAKIGTCIGLEVSQKFQTDEHFALAFRLKTPIYARLLWQYDVELIYNATTNTETKPVASIPGKNGVR